MSDINVGFGKVLRVRWLQASPQRKHLINGPKIETIAAVRVRHEKATQLLERRAVMCLAKEDTTGIEREIRSLGYEFEDEPSRPGLYSYWRRK